MSCRYGDDTCNCLPSCEDMEAITGGPICDCGVVIETWGAGQCSMCASAPHDRECSCDECTAYWKRICDDAPIAPSVLSEWESERWAAT